MCQTSGKLKLGDDFKRCFPSATVLAVIEARWWELQSCAKDAFDMHLLAVEVRRVCCGEKSKVVVQGWLNVGNTYSTKASSCGYYFKAWEIARGVCGEHHEVTRRCGKEFLEVTKRTTTTTTTTTEVVKRKETVTRYVYQETKLVHGECHEETIRCGKALAEILVTLKKVEESLTVLREVRKACVEVFGELHEETTSVMTTLTTVLTKKSSSSTSKSTTTTTTTTTEIEEITKLVLETCVKTLSVWEERRITATIKMIELYETKKDYKLAEELLVKMLTEIKTACNTHDHSDKNSDHVHEAKIEITLQYFRFLKRPSRDKEAEKILVELWAGYKDKLHDEDCDHGHGLLVRIRIVGEEMKKWKIVAIAESVFETLFGRSNRGGWRRKGVRRADWLGAGFYKRTGKTTTKEGSTIGWLFAGEVGCHDHHSEEIILRELYEQTISSKTTTTTSTVTIVKFTLKLCEFYERQQKWTEAVEVCRKALLKVWVGFSEVKTKKGGYCGLPARDHSETLKVAFKLAGC